eukprot:TRINITY_DN3268_c0_g2_i1.p1 TRINITY_DN3268_c0_g2~~TRINITY_DN3268_c0_g2_i1.p1  ORF type:complete len:164 (-),score=26.39 TRINITY_DN3268_c0_g2_i1:70-528(-)
MQEWRALAPGGGLSVKETDILYLDGIRGFSLKKTLRPPLELGSRVLVCSAGGPYPCAVVKLFFHLYAGDEDLEEPPRRELDITVVTLSDREIVENPAHLHVVKKKLITSIFSGVRTPEQNTAYLRSIFECLPNSLLRERRGIDRQRADCTAW